VLAVVLITVQSGIKQKIFLTWVEIRAKDENCQWRSDFCVVSSSKEGAALANHSL